MWSKQISMVSIEELLSNEHQYSKSKEIFDFSAAEKVLAGIKSGAIYRGYGVGRLFKCLLVQFMEDLSDRELERYVSDSNAGKWFYEFGLREKTPDHSVFSKMRPKIGTESVRDIWYI